MKVFRSLPPPDARTPCALAIGNFDGVHRGHKALLAKVREAAQRLNIVSAVMTFQPHPREYFARLSGDLSGVPPTIANLRDKLLAFSCAGMDRVVVEHFAGRFAALSADEFIEDILVKGMQIKWLIVGEDFCFGANRAGRIPELRQAAARYGFELAVMTEVQSEGERISSSLIRDALAEGDFRRAAGLLGHPYAISGRVIHGQRLGRDLGFPTLNLRMPQAFPVLTGIFITRVHGLTANPLPAVSCIGSRPTIEAHGKRLLETHVMDFHQDAYGKLVKIEFLQKLRENIKFDSLEALKKAIQGDVDQARAYFGH